MSDDGGDSLRGSGSWDTYWRGSSSNEAYSAGGTSHPAIVSFWDELFRSPLGGNPDARIVDMASGNGAILEIASQVCGDELPDFTCVDISESAIASIGDRFPSVTAVSADIRDTSLPTGAYTLATSQFGLEYAGLDAVAEMLRLIAAEGTLALLIHHRHGGIYRQCSASLSAIRQMISAKFIPHSADTFEAAFEVMRGGDPAVYQAAAKRLQPAIRTMESILQQHGLHVADGTIFRLYRDVRDIHSRIRNYDRTEVVKWLEGMQGEVEAFAERMQSMCDAAVDSSAFSSLCAEVEAQGFTIDRGDPLIAPGRGEALAWALIAHRS